MLLNKILEACKKIPSLHYGKASKSQTVTNFERKESLANSNRSYKISIFDEKWV